jgi:preprotein translocase subunit SecG
MLDFFVYLLTGVEVVLALLLIVLVLLQRSKSGGGLGGLTGGGSGAEEVLGANAGNILTKATTILATIFLVNTLALTVLEGKKTRRTGKSTAEQTEVVGETQPSPLDATGSLAPTPAGTADVGSEMATDQNQDGGSLAAPAPAAGDDDDGGTAPAPAE